MEIADLTLLPATLQLCPVFVEKKRETHATTLTEFPSFHTSLVPRLDRPIAIATQ